MRGRHLVRKVLQAACKAFALDYERSDLKAVSHIGFMSIDHNSNYRSRLILSVPIEHDDGEMESVEFDCPEDDTMARCGVNSLSKLFVKVEAGPDESDDE
jgi:hypothetical protein